jgi:hypothetical protein
VGVFGAELNGVPEKRVLLHRPDETDSAGEKG